MHVMCPGGIAPMGDVNTAAIASMGPSECAAASGRMHALHGLCVAVFSSSVSIR